MRKTVASIVCASALTIPVGNVWAASRTPTAQKKKVVTVSRSVTSPLVNVDRWGELRVAVKLNVTSSTVAGKTTKSWKVTSISFPVYPSHTDRSAFISERSLPILKQEVLQMKGNSIQLVSGATDTSYAFVEALRGALAKAGID